MSSEEQRQGPLILSYYFLEHTRIFVFIFSFFVDAVLSSRLSVNFLEVVEMSLKNTVDFLVIFLLIVDMASASEVYSSIAELERLYLKEQQVGQRLEKYLDLVKKQMTTVDQYVMPGIR